MDIGKAFTYIFDDEKWLTKVLFGGLFTILSSVLIGIPFVLGYMVETLRNVAAEEPSPLPDWSDLGEKFTRGLSLAIALLIYCVPFIVVACIAFFAGVRSDNTAIRLVGSCFTCLGLIYLLALVAISPAIIMRYAATGEIMAAFQFGEIISLITQNLGNYFMGVILSLVACLLAGFGLILCGVGVFFTLFWASLVAAHLLGQVYRQAGLEGATL